LVRSGRARVVLVSGDGNGASGDEPAAMTAYLTGRLGVDPWRVVGDPFELDTYDSCSRARDHLASSKAAWDAVRRRPPAVRSPVSPGVRDALRKG